VSAGQLSRRQWNGLTLLALVLGLVLWLGAIAVLVLLGPGQ
jgi:hypothetical protein